MLDAWGRFFHEGEVVEHAGLARGFASWLRKHPDNGRFILSNGYDWCYLTVEDTPFFVLAVRQEGDGLTVRLSDGEDEELRLAQLWSDEAGALRTPVKNGEFVARFSRSAQLQIEPWLVEGDPVSLELAGRRYPIATGPKASLDGE